MEAKRAFWILIGAAVMMSGCATPTLKRPAVSSAEVAAERRKETEMAVAAHADRVERLHRVAAPILAAAADFCGRKVFFRKDSQILQCNYPVQLVESETLNAFADGKRVVVFSGMLDFAATDAELALVIGHEMAHNILGHTRRKKINAASGLALDLLAAAARINTGFEFAKKGAQAYSRQFEAEADYAGLYIMARAGYDVSGAANFWRRMAVKTPQSIAVHYGATHPSAPERFVAIEKTAAEIEAKKKQGLPLIPNQMEGVKDSSPPAAVPVKTEPREPASPEMQKPKAPEPPVALPSNIRMYNSYSQ